MRSPEAQTASTGAQSTKPAVEQCSNSPGQVSFWPTLGRFFAGCSPAASSCSARAICAATQQCQQTRRTGYARPWALAQLLSVCIALSYLAAPVLALTNNYCSSFKGAGSCPPCRSPFDLCQPVDSYWDSPDFCVLPDTEPALSGGVGSCGPTVTLDMVSASDRTAVAGQLIAFQTPDDYLYLTFRLACPFALRPGFSSDVPYSLGVYLWNNTDMLGNPQYADGLTLSSGVYTCLSVVVDLRRVCNPARSVYMSNTPSAQANFNCGCFPGSRPCPPADMSAAELLVAQPAFYTLPSPANCKPAAGTALNKYIANTADGSGLLQWDATACGPVGTPKRSPSPAPGKPPTGVRNDQLPNAPPDMSPPPSLFSTPPPPSASPVPASSPPRGALPPPPRLQEEAESPSPPPLPTPSQVQPAPPPTVVIAPNTSQPSTGPTPPNTTPTPVPATPTPTPSPSAAISNEDPGGAVGGNHTTTNSSSGPPQPQPGAASFPPPTELSSGTGGGSSFFNGAGIGIIVGCAVIGVAVLACCCIIAYVYCRRGARGSSSSVDGDSLGRNSTKSALGLGLGRNSSRSDRSLTNFSFAMVPHAYEYEQGGKEGSLRGGLMVLGGGPGDSSRHGGGRSGSGRDMEKGGSGGGGHGIGSGGGRNGRGGIYTYPLDGGASGGSATESHMSHLSRLSGHDALGSHSRPLSSQNMFVELDGPLPLPVAQPVSSSALPGAGGADPRGLLQAHAVAAAAMRGTARQLAGRGGAATDGSGPDAGAIELQAAGFSGNGGVGRSSRGSKARKFFLFGGGSAGAATKSTVAPASAAEVGANASAALPARRLSARDAADRRHSGRHHDPHDHGSEVGSDEPGGGGACGSSFSMDTNGTLLPRAVSGLSTSSLLSALSGASGRLGRLGGSRSPGGGTGTRSPVLSGSHAHTAAASATTVDLLPELPMPPLPPPLLQPTTSMERSLGSVRVAHAGGSISMAGTVTVAAPVTPSASAAAAAAAVTEVEASEPSLSGRSSGRSPPATAVLASAGSLGGHALLLPAQGSLGPNHHHQHQHQASGLLHARASGAMGAAAAHNGAAAVVVATAAVPFSTSSCADSSAGASPLLSGRPSLAAPPLAMGGQLLAPAQSLGGSSGAAVLSSHASGGLLGSRGSLRTSPSTGAGGVPTLLAHGSSHNYASVMAATQQGVMTGAVGPVIAGSRYPSIFADAPASPLPNKAPGASSAPATTFASPGTASPAAIVTTGAHAPTSRRPPPHLASIPSLGTLPEHLPESSFATHAPLNLDDDDDDATVSGTLLRGGAAGDGAGMLAPYGSAAASPSLSPSGGIEAHSSSATTASAGSAVTLYSASLRRAGSSSHGGVVAAGTGTGTAAPYGALQGASSMARAATTGGSGASSASGPPSLATTSSAAASSNASSAAARLPGRPSAAAGSRSGPNSQGGAAGTPPSSINPAGSVVLPAEASPFAGATMLQQQLALAFLQQRASLSPPASPPPHAGSLGSRPPMSAPAPAMRGGAAGGGAVASSLSSATAAGGNRDSANFTFNNNNGLGPGEKLLQSTGAGTALGLLRTAASAALLGASADTARASAAGSPLQPGRASAAAIPATSPLPSPTAAAAAAAAVVAASSSPQPGSPLMRSAASEGRGQPASPQPLLHAASTPSPQAAGRAASPAPSPSSASPRSASPAPPPQPVSLQPRGSLPATPPASSLTSSRSGSPLPVPPVLPHAHSVTGPSASGQQSLQLPQHPVQPPLLASVPSLASASSAALGSPSYSSSLLQLAPSLRTTQSVATSASSGGASLRSAESLPAPGGSSSSSSSGGPGSGGAAGAAAASVMDLTTIRRYCAESGVGGTGGELSGPLGGGSGGDQMAALYTAVCKLERGTLFCNKYKIRNSPLLGRHSVVLLAKNVYSRARVAIKFHATRHQYEREKAALRALSSTYVPALEEPLEGPELAALGLPPALVMEAGRCTLTEWLRGEGSGTTGPRQPRDLLALKSALHQVLAALVHLHSRRLVHRDVKPANIMWFDGGHRFKLVDLAEAAAVGEPAPPCCTPLYSPPEQLRAALDGQACAAAVTPAADMWAFGVLAAEVLSGSRFYGPSPSLQAVLEAVFGHRPLPCEGGEASALAGVELAQARRLIAHLVVRVPAQRWSAATCHRNALFTSGDDTEQRARAWDTRAHTPQLRSGGVGVGVGAVGHGQPPPPPPAPGRGGGGAEPGSHAAAGDGQHGDGGDD